MNPVLVLRTISLLAALTAAAAVRAANEPAVKTLRAAQPAVRWQAKTTARGDFTCDGREDTALVGYGRRGEPWIGVVPGAPDQQTGAPSTLKFRLGNGRQDALCATPVRIETAPLDCADRESGPMPGCQPVPGCRALALVDDRCDAIHLYWDTDQHLLRWWRH